MLLYTKQTEKQKGFQSESLPPSCIVSLCHPYRNKHKPFQYEAFLLSVLLLYTVLAQTRIASINIQQGQSTHLQSKRPRSSKLAKTSFQKARQIPKTKKQQGHSAKRQAKGPQKPKISQDIQQKLKSEDSCFSLFFWFS